MPRDGFVTLASQLTPEEAGMAQQLLESSGVEALIEDQALSSVDPLVRFAIDGTKLLVREEDAAEARALLDVAGVLAPASAHPAEDVEIPEEEWSAPPPPAAVPDDADGSRRAGARVLVLVFILAVAAVAVLGLSARPSRPLWMLFAP